MKKLERLAEWGAQATIFFLPIVGASNLFLVLCQRCGYIRGLRSDYLLPKLYAVDLVLLVLLTTLGFLLFVHQKNSNTQLISKVKNVIQTRRVEVITTTLVMVLLLARQVLAPFPVAASINFVQIITLISVGVLYLPQVPRVKKKLSQLLLAGVASSAVLQSLIGLYQFFTQHSLLPYHFLGETVLTNQLVTRISFAGASIIPAHGTTPHPNVLAGFLALFAVILVRFITFYRGRDRALLNVALTVPITLCLSAIFYTQSFSGTAVLIAGGLLILFEQTAWKRAIIKHYKKVIGFILASTLLVSLATVSIPTQLDGSDSFFRRQYLLETSWNILKEPLYLLFGTGLSQFTAIAETYSTTTEIVRFNQPVHHVVWLMVTELGIIALLVTFGVLLYQKRKLSNQHAWNTVFMLVLLSPILVWDHYLFSLQVGRILLLICILSLGIRFEPAMET